jgi:hypothetical protein
MIRVETFAQSRPNFTASRRTAKALLGEQSKQIQRSNIEEKSQAHLIGTALQRGSASLAILPPVL